MDMLAAMRTFVRVAEVLGFSPVARESGTTQPTVSRTVAALEAHLGVRLINRTTRSLSLTDDGRQFYELAKRAVEAADEAAQSVGARRSRPGGLLRFGIPVAFGRLHIAPRMRAFLDRYPEVNVELSMSDSFVDLVAEGLDLAVRVGEITDPSLVARRIGTARRVTVASPQYLKRHGEPRHPSELVNHDCIVFTRLATANEWHFGEEGRALTVRVQGRLRADNAEAIREAVVGGIGIAVSPNWLFMDDVSADQVRVILRDFEPKPLPIHAVYPSRRQVPAKVRAMIDFLVEAFAREPLVSGNA